MVGSRNRLKALTANLLALGASGVLEQRQVEEVISALNDLWRAASREGRRETARSVDKLARAFIRATEKRGN